MTTRFAPPLYGNVASPAQLWSRARWDVDVALGFRYNFACVTTASVVTRDGAVAGRHGPVEGRDMQRRDLMGTAVELAQAVDGLAALAAHLRLEGEPVAADARVRALLADVAAELLGEPLGDPGPAAAPVVGLASTFLRQGLELVENPGRQGGWDQVDVPLLQGVGRTSMGVVEAVRAAEGELDSLAERLHEPDAVFLDVGVGTGWLSIAVARAYPGLRLVGIDIFEPALDLARGNITGEALEDRITLRRLNVTALEPTGDVDVVWLPLPFLRREIVPDALVAVRGALRPGGWLLASTFTGPPGRLAQLLADLRTLRSGGHPWQPEELIAAMATAGFGEVREVARTWRVPVRLYAGRRP
jgi:SAM-dependent methyltransferase